MSHALIQLDRSGMDTVAVPNAAGLGVEGEWFVVYGESAGDAAEHVGEIGPRGLGREIHGPKDMNDLR